MNELEQLLIKRQLLRPRALLYILKALVILLLDICCLGGMHKLTLLIILVFLINEDNKLVEVKILNSFRCFKRQNIEELEVDQRSIMFIPPVLLSCQPKQKTL